jgi:vacuolar-type H+-ATPase subunit F/Vma7
MSQIIVLGGTEFTLGFQLAGIKTIEPEKNINNQFEDILENKDIGILITDQKTINKLDEHLKERIIESVKPVTVIVSEEESQEELKKMIKKSIGVDLWK